jgi:hypothetical protein
MRNVIEARPGYLDQLKKKGNTQPPSQRKYSGELQGTVHAAILDRNLPQPQETPGPSSQPMTIIIHEDTTPPSPENTHDS